jgi:DNA-binding XRE family transcriptional regulator
VPEDEEFDPGEAFVDGSAESIRRSLAAAEQSPFFAQIAEQVSARRRELGLSQQELARLVGTTQSAVARLERGARPPRIDTLLRIAAALESSLRVELVPHADATDDE